MDAAKTLTGQFTLLKRTLTVDPTGDGGVTTDPAGDVACNPDCDFDHGTPIIATAVADGGWVFVGWDDCATPNTNGTCSLTMDSDQTLSPIFREVRGLTISTTGGSGSGKVESAPLGIDCPLDCNEEFTDGTEITLTAAPAQGSVFHSWTGCPEATGDTCTLTMDGNKTVTAVFKLQRVLTVTKSGGGTGTVTSPAAIDCGTDCTEVLAEGAEITLTALPATGSLFHSWKDCPDVNPDGTCTVTMDTAKTVTARFEIAHELNVSLDGSGTATTTDGKINCPGACEALFPKGSEQFVTATPATGWNFVRWSNSCTTATRTTPECKVLLNATDNEKSITATFVREEYDLAVSKAGAGTGTVTSSASTAPTNQGQSINCGAECTKKFNFEQVVTLTAEPATGSTFTGWTGACTGTATTCQVTIGTANASVTATFSVQQQNLTITETGNGDVTTDPAGTSCGANCKAFAHNTPVTLTADPDTGSSLTAWGGACSETLTTDLTCEVTMNGAKSASATFTTNSYMFSVTKNGTGSGTVTSSPTGIDCGSDCSQGFDHGQQVVLTAARDADSNQTAISWTGCDSSTGTTCNVTVNGAENVAATFTENSWQLTVTRNGNGDGTVTSDPGDIDCLGECSDTFAHGTAVTLTAENYSATSTLEWSGACASETDDDCTVTMDQARNVTATFSLRTYTVTVTRAGDDVGSITSSPNGINCPTECTDDFNHGQTVTLTAQLDAGETVEWTVDGACTSGGGTSNTCTIDNITAAKSVTATFTAAPPTP
jgi:uncharacterized repeat protein (TIGR02543 family)